MVADRRPLPVPPVTVAEHRRALKAARRPDGTVDPFLYGLGVARPMDLDEPLPRETPQPSTSTKAAHAPRVKKAG